MCCVHLQRDLASDVLDRQLHLRHTHGEARRRERESGRGRGGRDWERSRRVRGAAGRGGGTPRAHPPLPTLHPRGRRVRGTVRTSSAGSPITSVWTMPSLAAGSCRLTPSSPPTGSVQPSNPSTLPKWQVKSTSRNATTSCVQPLIEPLPPSAPAAAPVAAPPPNSTCESRAVSPWPWPTRMLKQAASVSTIDIFCPPPTGSSPSASVDSRSTSRAECRVRVSSHCCAACPATSGSSDDATSSAIARAIYLPGIGKARGSSK